MKGGIQKLPVFEKVGYSVGDAAANFVDQTVILFQLISTPILWVLRPR
jgi:Na+/melibiose symporter-like transporter